MKKWLSFILLTFLLLAAPVLADININQADQRALQSLPGIGAVKATAIIAYRQKHGPFTHIDQLTQVKGIGKKTIQKLRQHITLQDKKSQRIPPNKRQS